MTLAGKRHPGRRPGCACGRLERLAQRNVDTGMGVERKVAVLAGHGDVFAMDTLWPLVEQLQALSGRSYAQNPRPFRYASMIHLMLKRLARAL